MTTKHNLYIVDDTADYRLMLQHLFTRFLPQYAVRFFSSGDDLYTHLLAVGELASEADRPELILLDLNMPGMSSYQLLIFLKQQAQWAYIPVVIMSSLGSVKEIQQCYQAGANSFLVKPNDFNELKQTMETICLYWLALNKSPDSTR